MSEASAKCPMVLQRRTPELNPGKAVLRGSTMWRHFSPLVKRRKLFDDERNRVLLSAAMSASRVFGPVDEPGDESDDVVSLAQMLAVKDGAVDGRPSMPERQMTAQ